MRNRNYTKMLTGILAAAIAVAAAGCGKSQNSADTASSAQTAAAAAQAETVQEASTEAETVQEAAQEATQADTEEIAEASDTQAAKEEKEKEEEVEIPEGYYASELTGLAEEEKLEDQRPVAVMIDNDPRALPHYGLADADIVYEMMNSTENSRVTRLMALYKDWKDVDQIGNIRSTRSTNILLASEYGAILVHDGGPFYIDSYLSSTGIAHLSGYFTRVKNGKATEFTEYAVGTEIADRASAAGYSSSYPKGTEKHFAFGKADVSDGKSAETVSLACFRLTKPYLKYDSKEKMYDYYEQDQLVKDAEDDETVRFKNVILQNCSFSQLDQNGYLIYNVIGTGDGWYITDGKAVPITWQKNSETGKTTFYGEDGKELVMNAGKTYIAVCPSDDWKSVSIK